MLTIYPAIFHKENDGYWVEFPDLEGCQTCGSSLQETVQMAQEVLGLYIATQDEKSFAYSLPTDIKNFATDKDSFVVMISTDVDSYRRKNKAVKKTLSIPQWLNEEAEKRHINFSSVLQNALKQEIERTATQ